MQIRSFSFGLDKLLTLLLRISIRDGKSRLRSSIKKMSVWVFDIF